MVKRLLRIIYRFCDHLDEVMRLYCEHQTHQDAVEAYDEALRRDPIVFYGGPYDGFHAFYRGLIIRFPEHPDGAYCFDGEIYTWRSIDSSSASRLG